MNFGNLKFTPPLLWGIALVLFVASELFVVQELTLNASHQITWYHWLASPIIRGSLDFLFASIIVLLFSRWLFYLFSLLEIGSLAALFAYYTYFRDPLSINTIIHQWVEGLSVAQFAFELIHGYVILALGISFAAKVFLREKFEKRPPDLRPAIKRLTLNCLLAYLSLIVISGTLIDPLKNIKNHAYLGSLGMTYGYFWTWMSELFFLNDRAILERALETARNRSAQPLASSVGGFKLGPKIVIIQVESLDYEVIRSKVDDFHITPYLNHIIGEAKVFRIRPIHVNGSADADFVTLMGLMPSADTINYKIAGFPFHENSLPGFLSAYGFETYAFHGATGYFFGRRDSYSNMGFKRVYFREELETILNVKSAGWGIRDKEVFQFSSNKIGEPDRKICHFIITLTSHGPYTFLLDSEKELYPDPSNLEENYLNSMRYVDRALQNYIESLPDETSVIIYGDHGAREVFSRRAKTEYSEFVPFIMYTKGIAQPDGELFEFSEIDLLDSISYFRDQLGSSASGQTPHPTNSHL